MILQALNLGLLTLLFFITGMIKPKWALFFMEKPTRLLITYITLPLVMIVMTMYGEGHKQAQLAEKHKRLSTESVATESAPTPEAVPVPVPVPTEEPKVAPKAAVK